MLGASLHLDLVRLLNVGNGFRYLAGHHRNNLFLLFFEFGDSALEGGRDLLRECFDLLLVIGTVLFKSKERLCKRLLVVGSFRLHFGQL